MGRLHDLLYLVAPRLFAARIRRVVKHLSNIRGVNEYCWTARVAELEAAGLIRRTGEYRRGQPVYVLTERGKRSRTFPNKQIRH